MLGDYPIKSHRCFFTLGPENAKFSTTQKYYLAEIIISKELIPLIPGDDLEKRRQSNYVNFNLNKTLSTFLKSEGV